VERNNNPNPNKRIIQTVNLDMIRKGGRFAVQVNGSRPKSHLKLTVTRLLKVELKPQVNLIRELHRIERTILAIILIWEDQDSKLELEGVTLVQAQVLVVLLLMEDTEEIHAHHEGEDNQQEEAHQEVLQVVHLEEVEVVPVVDVLLEGAEGDLHRHHHRHVKLT
jgi:hypothetical protein